MVTLQQSVSAELVLRALMMALLHRNPPEGIIFHSDRASQYTSSQVRQLLKSYKITQSMSSTGNCYDNAITESFFHTLKTELIYWNIYQTREEATRSIFEYIEVFYNRQRLHSAIGYLSPVEFEEKNLSSKNLNQIRQIKAEDFKHWIAKLLFLADKQKKERKLSWLLTCLTGRKVYLQLKIKRKS